MFGMRPKNTRKCTLCHGLRTETYMAEERVGGGNRNTHMVQKTRPCSGCGGLGWVA